MSTENSFDFNSAQMQATAFSLVPAKTLAKVRLSIRPGGSGPEGWLTQSKTSDAQYLDSEAVILEGPYVRRRLFTRIGIKGRSTSQRSDDVYADRGRALIRGILESARGVRSDDTSEAACAARKIRSIGDLDGLEFVAKVSIERDRNNPDDEGRNVIAAAITAKHADYARLMGVTSPVVPPAPTTGSPPPLPTSPTNGAAAPGTPPFWAR